MTSVPAALNPWRMSPGDKIVVLGLITSKRPQLEDKEHIKERILEASKYVPLDRLCRRPSAVLPPLRKATSSLRRISGRSWL